MASSRISVALLVLGFMVGALGGFAGAYVAYQPRIYDYESQIVVLQDTAFSLNSSLVEEKAKVSAFESQVDFLITSLSTGTSALLSIPMLLISTV